MEKLTQNFIRNICAILEIEPPRISSDVDDFPTDTTLAAVCIPADGGKPFLCLRENVEPDPGYYVQVAHELRHLWQLENDNGYWFGSYKSIEELRGDLTRYNLQPAEVDAHAFSVVVLVRAFGAAPTFETLGEPVRQAIAERLRQIAPEVDEAGARWMNSRDK